MKLKILASVAVAVSVWAPATQAAVINVAQGKPVAASGTFDSVPSLLPTVVDGVFLNEGTLWTSGTVYWRGLNPALTVDLQGSFTISSFIVQADDNDSYRIEYRDGANPWQTAWNVPNYDAGNVGMTTRPDATHTTRYMLPAPLTASELRFTATGGDGYYSVSEIQAFAPVPEPGTYLAGLSALGMLGLFSRRNRK
jgi:hypothetical protein